MGTPNKYYSSTSLLGSEILHRLGTISLLLFAITCREIARNVAIITYSPRFVRDIVVYLRTGACILNRLVTSNCSRGELIFVIWE